MKKSGNTIVSFAAAAFVAVCGLSATADLVPSTRLPLPTEGLVFHGDAGETSSITTDAAGHVLEWRSMHGSVAFAVEDGQDPTNLPYYKPCINVPATAQVPGIVFGLEPGYEYVGVNGGDSDHLVNTYLKATNNISVREVFMMMVNRPNSATHAALTIQGTKNTPANAHFIYAGTQRAEDGNVPAIYVKGSRVGNRFVAAEGFFGKSGSAWIDGVLKLDWPTGTYHVHNNPTHGLFNVFEIANNTLFLMNGVSQTNGFSGPFSLGLKTTDVVMQQNFPQMDLCEFVVYDRRLTDEERAYVTRSIRDKWQNKIPHKTWTGAAGDGKWSTPENWSDAAVPDGSESAVISGAAVTLDADAACSLLVLDGGASITVSAGRTLTVKSLFVPNGESTVTGAGNFRYAGEKDFFRVPDNLGFGAELTVEIAPGCDLDLNGNAVTCASLLGRCLVTNTAADTAELVMGAVVDGALEACLTGDITLVKRGEDTTVSVAAPQRQTPPVRIEGGTLKASPVFMADVLEGCVLHIDASRPETMTLDADNRVQAWSSTVDPDDVFVTAETNESIRADLKAEFSDDPVYLAGGINGTLPCVRFGLNDDGTRGPKTGMKLGAARGEDEYTLKQRTVVIVHVPAISYGDTIVPYGRYFLGSPGSRYYSPISYSPESGACYSGTSQWGGGTNVIYVNGVKEVDVPNGQTPARFGFCYTTSAPYSDHPHILTVTIPELDDDPPVETFRPVLGTRIFRSYNDDGNYEYKNYCGRICEVIVFDRCLTEDERQRLETSLAVKWFDAAGFTGKMFQRAENAYETAFSSVDVKGDATLDFNGLDLRLESLLFDALGAESIPSLDVFGVVDIGGVALSFAGTAALTDRSYEILRATDLDGASFGSVDGLPDDRRIGISGESVYFRFAGNLTVFIR